jgi:hypothetical protein
LAHAVGQGLEQIAVIGGAAAPEGGELLRLETPRGDREEILNEIVLALQQAGYHFVKAEIAEIVDEAVRTSVAGVLTLGGIAGAKTRNPLITLTAAAVGGWAGAVAGAQVQSVASRHLYRWLPSEGWVTTDLGISSSPAIAQQPAAPLFA